ncbi:class I SAM-dependent methyltransferase [Elusimicrobiota bacterium]
MEEINDDTYKKWHETYVGCTTEKEKVENALAKLIAASPKRDTFLDVGAGDGDLTFRVAKHFQNATVIEPNKQVRGIFESKNVEFIEGYFENIDLDKRTFDLILCSQVFWLVKRENQAAFIKKMHSHLAPGGKLAIIMVSPLGQSHRFYEKFFFDHNTTTHTILGDLHVMGLSAQVIPISFDFKSKSFEDFFNICKLFTLESWLHPVNMSDERIKKEIGNVERYTEKKLKEISQFIKDECHHNGEYLMNEEVDIIVVSKE